MSNAQDALCARCATHSLASSGATTRSSTACSVGAPRFPSPVWPRHRLCCAARRLFEDSFQFLRGEDEEFEEARRILEPEEESEDGERDRATVNPAQIKLNGCGGRGGAGAEVARVSVRKMTQRLVEMLGKLRLKHQKCYRGVAGLT